MQKRKTKSEFLQDIMTNANHHAKGVIGTFKTIWTAFDAAPDLQIKKWRTHTCYIQTPNDMYFFTYCHDKKSIDIKLRGQRGPLLKSFNDATDENVVWQYIINL